MSSLKQTLKSLLDAYQDTNPRLLQSYDPEWRSPCEEGGVFDNGDGEQIICWRPQPRNQANDFTGLENALETEIHADIKNYYGSYWSGPVETKAQEGHVGLIFLWNPMDVNRLVENLIGHAMAQQRSRSPLSIFFACTEEDSELFLTVRNEDGVVQLEKPGYKPVREVAGSLNEFLQMLSPSTPGLQFI